MREDDEGRGGIPLFFFLFVTFFPGNLSFFFCAASVTPEVTAEWDWTGVVEMVDGKTYVSNPMFSTTVLSYQLPTSWGGKKAGLRREGEWTCLVHDRLEGVSAGKNDQYIDPLQKYDRVLTRRCSPIRSDASACRFSD